MVLGGKSQKNIQLMLEFLKVSKVLANNADAEDNTSGLLKRGGIAHSTLLKTLLVIRQRSQEQSFWEVMDSFVLVEYASLAAWKTFLQQLLACLNFTLDSEIYSVGIDEKSDFYELWQQHQLLKTMEMSEVWTDTYDEGYVHQFQPEPTNKIN